MENVFFKPWVGKNYHTGGIFKKKILVVGESHYCGGCNECGLKYSPECDELTTTGVMEFYLAGNTDTWTPTFKKFERSLVNKETTLEESRDIWNSIAFFNFLQVAMNGSRQAGRHEDYIEGQKALSEVVDELQPDLIIVWGVTRMYQYFPSEGWIPGEEINIDGYNLKNGYYKTKGTKVVFVYHPSTGYEWDWWYEALAPFL